MVGVVWGGVGGWGLDRLVPHGHSFCVIEIACGREVDEIKIKIKRSEIMGGKNLRDKRSLGPGMCDINNVSGKTPFFFNSCL